MKNPFPFSTTLVAMSLIVPATADTIYSNLQDTPIPTDFTGVFIDVDGNSNWDINPFFGGVGVANSAAFQPVRTSAGNLGTLQNFAVGSSIDVSGLFATGMGGSQDHLGNTFISGQEGYLGFKLNGNYGWMRVVFTGNTAGAVVKDWAYDNSGAAIITGRVQQSAVSAGTQLVTLSPGSGESFTLGSLITNTGSNINSVLKTGAGTTTLSGSNSYSGVTGISNGKLIVNGSIASSSATTVNSGGTLAGSGTVGTLTVDSGGILSPGNGVGSLTLTNGVTLAGSYIWELGALSTSNPGSDFDILTIVGGDADITGATIGLSLGAFAPSNVPFWQSSQTWSGILYNTGLGTLTGTFAAIDNTAWSSIGSFTTTTTGNDVNLVWSAVPEPGSAGLIGGLGVLALLGRRRNAI